MCKWIPIPNYDYLICFACSSFHSRAGFLASAEPLKLVRIGDKFLVKKYIGYENIPLEQRTAMVRFVNLNHDRVTCLYRSWLGQLLLEDICEEE